MTRRRLTPLQEAYAPYLDELNLCECDTCHAVAFASRPRRDWHRWPGDRPSLADERAYWSAVSDQLREVVEGRHVRRELAEWVTSLPPATRTPHVSISTGLGIGVNRQLDLWTSPTPSTTPRPQPEPQEPPAGDDGQYSLFPAA